MNKKSNPLIKAVTFRVFTLLVLLFTIIIYIIILGLAYLQYTGGIDIIYTDTTTHLLITLVGVLFVIGWFLSYTLYIGIIKPVYETLNIISETVSNLISKDEIDKEQVVYLSEFINHSLSQLSKSSLTHKINLSLSTESYLKKLGELMRQNEELTNSKKELSRLVEQLKDQQELLELEKAKTNAIIDSIPNGLLVTGKDGNIFLVNKELENILGLELNGILGKFIYNILPDIHLNKELTKKDSENHRYTSFFNYKSIDQKKNMILENTSNPIILNDDILGSVFVLRDTTQERATERAQKEFVSLASHQLRTPITSIKWNSEIILSNNTIDEEVKLAANDIYREGNRMEKLVNSLLNLSRIDLGKIKFNTQEIYLDKYIQDLVKTLSSEIDSKNLVLETDILLKNPIKNDPVYLDIILTNILYNAIKYTNANGTIRLKADIMEDKEKVLITISDTGIGIPQSQQSQIFSRLFRADNAKNCQTDGNGLGLYIVKKLIELMNGNVWFESQENKGTTFFIELPIVINDEV